MDLQAFSQMNNTLTDHLNKMQKSCAEKKDSVNNNTKKKNNDIVLARKGDSGYVKCFDIDNDGEITLDEFNQYCEENSVSEKEKIKILSLMNSAKTGSKIIDKTAVDNDKKDDENAIKESGIYARKGDDKYNENMDSDRNDIVTYREYIEYCNKRTKETENDNSAESKAVQAYSKIEHFDEEEDISVEAEA